MILDSVMHIFLILAMMHICKMHLSMILHPDTCMYDAYIYVPQSLTLKHACVYDAYIYDP